MKLPVRYLIFFAASTFVFGSCVKPESLPVEREELTSVLADVHVAETVLVSYNEPEKDSLAKVYYRQILAIHDMDREVFDTCIAILRRNPELMTEVYGEVLEYIEKQKIEQE